MLLILAGVCIATLTGENGILTRAHDAKAQTGVAEEKEAISLAYSGAVAEKRGTGDITASRFKQRVRNKWNKCNSRQMERRWRQ